MLRYKRILTQSKRFAFKVEQDRNRCFSKLDSHQTSRDINRRICPFKEKVPQMVKYYVPSYPIRFNREKEPKQLFFPNSGNTLNLDNYDRLFIITCNRYATFTHTMVRRNSRFISVWQQEKFSSDHAIAVNNMRSYLTDRGTNTKWINKNFFVDLREYFLKWHRSKQRTACILQFLGEHDYRRITQDELGVLQNEKRKVEKEGLAAFAYKLRSPEQLVMVFNGNYMTRKFSRLKDTRYTSLVNSLHPHRYRKYSIPSEFNISDRRSLNLTKSVEMGRSQGHKQGTEVNAIHARQNELLNREYYYNTFVKLTRRALDSVFDIAPEFFHTDRPCGLVSRLDRDMALTFYNLYAPDSLSMYMQKEIISNMIYSNCMNGHIMSTGGYLDVKEDMYHSSMLSHDLLSDSMFFTYMIINSSELHKPYRSFPNIHWNSKDVKSWMRLNFKYDNHIDYDLSTTLRFFGGTTTKLYNNNLRQQVIAKLQTILPDYSTFHDRHKLYTETHLPVVHKASKTNKAWPPQRRRDVDRMPSNFDSLCKKPLYEEESLNKITAIQNWKTLLKRRMFTMGVTTTVNEFLKLLHIYVSIYNDAKNNSEQVEPFFHSLWGWRDSEICYFQQLISYCSAIHGIDLLEIFNFHFRTLKEPLQEVDHYTQPKSIVLYMMWNHENPELENNEKQNTIVALNSSFATGTWKERHERAYLEHFEKNLINIAMNEDLVFVMPTSRYPCMGCQDYVSHCYDPRDLTAIEQFKLEESKAREEAMVTGDGVQDSHAWDELDSGDGFDEADNELDFIFGDTSEEEKLYALSSERAQHNDTDFDIFADDPMNQERCASHQNFQGEVDSDIDYNEDSLMAAMGMGGESEKEDFWNESGENRVHGETLCPKVEGDNMFEEFDINSSVDDVSMEGEVEQDLADMFDYKSDDEFDNLDDLFEEEPKQQEQQAASFPTETLEKPPKEDSIGKDLLGKLNEFKF